MDKEPTSRNSFNLVDPNDFTGLSNVNASGRYNVFVPIEDLNISVELSTSTKPRSLLTLTSEGGSENKSSGESVRINFIEGSEVNNKRYLTTNYTDFQNLSSSDGEESLGITNIDIDFSSSFAPKVVINFIDVRGGAIFQNGANSKYGVLFKMPYPIFELKIKGYYGKPVKYCLHLIKVNSKFNAQTGNFEITAEFIGYTYAMLSDLLVGYLKAIPETKAGKEIFTPELEQKEGIIPISTLIKRIGDIDGVKDDILVDSKLSKDLEKILYAKEKFNQIINSVDRLFNELKNNSLLPADNEIIIKTPPSSSQQTSVFNSPYPTSTQSPVTNDDDKFINSYKETVTNYITEYNASIPEGYDDLKIVDEDFFIDITTFSDITRDDIEQENSNLVTQIKEEYNTPEYRIETLNKLKRKITTTDTTGKSKLIIYDFSYQFSNGYDRNLFFYNEETRITKELSELFRQQVKIKLGFDPTIRNIVKIFAKHIEVLLGILYNVSAEYKTSAERATQLDKFKCTNRVDVKCGHDIYPWPEYNNEYNKEQYLGSEGVVAIPLDIPEVKFVEEFYQAILTAYVKDKEAEQALLNEAKTIWASVNPLDTYVFNSSMLPPYKRISTPVLPEKIADTVLARAVTYLNITNRKLNTDEIEKMAAAEATTLVNDLNGEVNNNLINFANYWDAKKIMSITNNEDGVDVPDLTKDGDNLRWKYLGYTIDNLHLDDYNASEFEQNNKERYPADGIFVKIFSDSSRINFPPASEVKINYLNLKSHIENINANGEFKNVGFDASNGTQIFRLIDWGDSSLANLDLRYVFYSDGNAKANGLCGSRLKATTFDLTSNVAELPVFYGNSNEARFNDLLYNEYVHPNLGKNRIMATDSKSAYPHINFNVRDNSSDYHFSLFGSRFYYEQSVKGRAFLFLHSFPWTGLCDDDTLDLLKSYGIFHRHEIMNLFAYRGGFIQVPKLWPAFVGGLLWRMRTSATSGDPIKFRANGEEFLPTCDEDTVYPTADYYLSSKKGAEFGPLSFHGDNRLNPISYKKIDKLLYYLPEQVINEFIENFESFVTNDWDEIRKTLELMEPNATGSDWLNKYNETEAEIITHSTPTNSLVKMYIPTANLRTRYKNLDNYIIFGHIANRDVGGGIYTNGKFKYNTLLELKEGSTAMNMVSTLFNEAAWIANTQWAIWGYADYKTNVAVTEFDPDFVDIFVNKEYVESETPFRYFSVSNSELNLYLDKLHTKVQELVESTQTNINKEVFGVSENNEVKLNIYRTLKAIYDKWIAGSESAEEILFQCGNRLPNDAALAAHRNGDGTVPTLIDSFRFINRSFQDIGDDFFINPLMLRKLLVGNANQSIYALLSTLLTENNFDFVALPAFVNFNDIDEVKSIFKPYTYEEATNIAVSGPSFVCIYVGQVSTKLDFNNDNEYSHKNDGIDFNNVESLPSDFSAQRKDWEETGVAFMVNYGHQNQNIFKDVTLDQSEFTETSESLQIMDDIANSVTEKEKSYIGQNLYNVWSVRSYKAQVEMMGNAMIQPMMYFQLNNIPMFHGAYLITSVKHNIKPNYMTTTFSGVRIKDTLTPLVEAAAMYSSILGDYKPLKPPDTRIVNSDKKLNNYVDKYFAILINNKI